MESNRKGQDTVFSALKPGKGFYFFPKKVNKNSPLRLFLIKLVLWLIHHSRNSQGGIERKRKRIALA